MGDNQSECGMGKNEVRLTEIGNVKDEPFDLILANINKHILVDIAKSIVDLTFKVGSTLITCIPDNSNYIKRWNAIIFLVL